MDHITLKAQEREVLGKKVKKLRRDGLLPAHVYGNKVETEHVTVKVADFLRVFNEAGETHLVELRIGEEKMRPVLIRDVQVDPIKGNPLHIDFYQVNLKEKVTVPVPIELIGEEPEKVHAGEAVVIQPMSEVEVEALPTELPEKIEVDLARLVNIDDVVTVAQLKVPEGATILAEPEAVVVKLDNAVTAEMEALMAEQEAEQEAALEAQEGEAPVEGEEQAAEEGGEGEGDADKEDKPEGEAAGSDDENPQG